jgi:hypothetical protein
VHLGLFGNNLSVKQTVKVTLLHFKTSYITSKDAMTKIVFLFSVLVCFSPFAGSSVWAQSGQTNTSATNRQRFPGAKDRELRSKETNRPSDQIGRFKEEWKSLSPEERASRLKAIRERNLEPSTEEREARVAQVRARIQKRLEALAVKKAKGEITPEEEKQLEKGRKTLQRYEEQKMKRKASPRPE